MQILNRKKGDDFIKVEVEKIWSDIDGIQIGLTPDGDYITLDGEPVQEPSYFKIMPLEDRRKAEAWWRRRQDKAEGKEPEKTEEQVQSPPSPDPSYAAMFSAALDTMQKNQEEFLGRLAVLFAGTQTGEAAPLKAVYTRQKGDSINTTAPKNWEDFGFTEQPDWWGDEAERTEMGGDGIVYTYRRFWVPDDQGGDKRGD